MSIRAAVKITDGTTQQHLLTLLTTFVEESLPATQAARAAGAALPWRRGAQLITRPAERTLGLSPDALLGNDDAGDCNAVPQVLRENSVTTSPTNW
jgi:hypothetical protein